MKQKRILTAALAAVLTLSLSVPALAAEAPTALPISAETPTYELVQRGENFPVRVWGTAVELGDMSLTLENSNDSDPYQKVVVNVGEDTLILDAVTGEAKTFDDLRAGEAIYAWVGPEMTDSLPPISTARVILCSIPADFGAPNYAEVETVTQTEDGVDVYMNNDVVLHLTGDTEYLVAPGWEKETVSAADIVPGTRLLSWYSVTTMSLPAQASPSKVMVFPSDYDGWVSTNGLEVTINGETLALEGSSAAKVENGRLMVPVRAVAEAMGCEVAWEPYTNQVSVTSDGVELYHFAIGADQAVKGDVTVGLVASAEAVDGVTFMALDDLIVLHSLKPQRKSAPGPFGPGALSYLVFSPGGACRRLHPTHCFPSRPGAGRGPRLKLHVRK